jgi:hypothetical protein
MPKRQRWTTQTYQLAYKMLTYRDGGEKCALCGREWGADTTKEEKKLNLGQSVQFEIDEVDGNPGNHLDWNLRLLCKTCNVALGCGWGNDGEGGMREVCVGVCQKPCDAMKRRLKTTRGARREDRAEENAKARERERTEGQPATRVVRDNLDYSSGSVEMQANGVYERRFREYVLDEIKERGIISWNDARDDGAELTGCSPKTAERYLDKLKGKRFGPLQLIKDEAGQKQLVFKERLSLEERSIAI